MHATQSESFSFWNSRNRKLDLDSSNCPVTHKMKICSKVVNKNNLHNKSRELTLITCLFRFPCFDEIGVLLIRCSRLQIFAAFLVSSRVRVPNTRCDLIHCELKRLCLSFHRKPWYKVPSKANHSFIHSFIPWEVMCVEICCIGHFHFDQTSEN